MASPTRRPAVLQPSPMSLGDVMTSAFRALRGCLGLLLGLMFGELVAMLALVAAAFGIFLAIAGVRPRYQSDDHYYSQHSTALLVVVVLLCVGVGVASVWFRAMQFAVVDTSCRGMQPRWELARERVRGVVVRSLPLLLLPAGFAVVTVLCVLAINALDRSGSSGPGWIFLLWFLLVLACLVMAVRWAFTVQALALEGLGGMAALRRSWRLTHRRFWPILGALLVCQLLASLVTSPVDGLMGSIKDANALLVLLLLLHFALQVLAGMWQTSFQTVLYVDHVRRDAMGPLPTPWGGPVGAAPVPAAWQPGGLPWAPPGPPQPQAWGQPQQSWGQQPAPQGLPWEQTGQQPWGQPPAAAAPPHQASPGPTDDWTPPASLRPGGPASPAPQPPSPEHAPHQSSLPRQQPSEPPQPQLDETFWQRRPDGE